MKPSNNTLMTRSLLSFLAVFLFANISLSIAQDPGMIVVSEVMVDVKGKQEQGNSAELPIVPGKMSGPYQLFVNDSLSINASYRVTAGGSGRSDLKDSSVKIAISYTVKYKGMTNEKRVDRIFYLDDERKFKEKESFNFALSKYSNAVVRIGYEGRLQ
jgi:hypothetical protein